MWWNRRLWLGRAAPVLLACGCTPLPWVGSASSVAPPPTPPPQVKAGQQGPGTTLPPPSGATNHITNSPPGAAPPGPTPATPSGSPGSPIGLPPTVAEVQAAGNSEPASRVAAELAMKLNQARDDSKVLAARLQEFYIQLDEKTRALHLARAEVRAVSEEIQQTRAEIARWAQEVAALKARAETAEKENQASLQTFLQMLQFLLDQEATRTVKPPKPEIPSPMP